MKSTVALFAIVAIAPLVSLAAEEWTIHSFERQQLTPIYFSEGASVGDINGDEVMDVVCGPYWFAGPSYQSKQEIYPAVPQNRDRYADNFFSWVYDFNGDGCNDVLTVGFPGTAAYVYENPGHVDSAQHWKKHQVLDWVSNESPQFVDLVGDPRPELVCTRDGFFGYATINADNPLADWEFHAISPQVTAKKFGHGLGIGDINGDHRNDILHAGGWYEQPATNPNTSRWQHHEVKFSPGYGGAEMYAYDVDGDGDQDVISSDRAHEFGLSWYEQVDSERGIEFRRHQIMGSHPSENKYGVLFSELHSVALADIDGDGLKDIVTGKTYWSHHRQSPMWDAGAVVVWFRLVRSDDGVDWIPYHADDQAGIGRQVTIADLNHDALPDIVVGGMKGSHVLIHRKRDVTQEQWEAAQPRIYDGPRLPSTADAKQSRGPKSQLGTQTGKVDGAIEGEALSADVSSGIAKIQDMSRFTADQWSSQSQLWWTGARRGDTMTLKLPEFTGKIDLEVVLTCARDYGIVQLSLDDQDLGKPIDLYEPNVVTTGVLAFEDLSVSGKQHSLKIQIVGANANAAKAMMVAIDYLRIKKPDGSFVSMGTASP